MNKFTYRLLNVIVLLALTFGGYVSVGASARSVAAPANIYYVSTSGNDASAGTSSAPFRTIQKAANIAVAGDIVNILSGTYNEKLKPANSGAPDRPIIFQKFGASPVIVKSSEWANINIDQKDWIIIDGLTIIGTASNIGIAIHDGNYNVIRNCEISNVTIGVHIYAGNSGSAETGVTAIGNVVAGNVIHDTSASLGEGIYVKNYMSEGITIPFTRDTIIENNTIYNAYEAIQNTVTTWIGGSLTDGGIAPSGTIVRGNKIYHNNCEQGVITMMGNGHLIENNIITDNMGTGTRCGISLRDGKFTVRYNLLANGGGSSSYRNAINLNDVTGEISNNTITNYDNRGVSVAYSKPPQGDLLIKNNIVYEIVKEQVVLSGDVSRMVLDNNLFGKSVQNLGTNYIIGNPLFVGTGDYHLQGGSSACGLGAFPCDFAAPTVSPASTPTVAVSFTPTLTWTNTPVAPSVTPSSVPSLTPTLAPLTATQTASPVPALPTATATAVQPTVIVTASPAPALPTATATAVQPTVIVTASPIPALPTATATVVQPTVVVTASPAPVLPTVAASPMPMVPTVPSVLEMVYDDKDGAFVYSAGWVDAPKKQAYNGSFKLTTRNGSSVTFAFTGQSFSVLYKGGPAFRKMDVYVDDVLVATIDEKTNRSSFQQRWDYAGQLAPGNHTLKLVFVTSNKSNMTNGSIDAVIVR